MFKATLKQILGRGSIILINQISVLLTIPILAARLDFLVFGQVAIGFVLVQLSWVLSDWGIQHYSIEQWPKLKTQLKKNTFTSTVTYLRTSIASLCIGLILTIILLGLIDFPALFLLCIIPSILMGGIYPLWFYQVQKSPHEMIGVTIFSRCIYLLMIIFLVHNNESAIWAFLAQGINMSIITIFAYLRMSSRYQFKLQKFQFGLWIRTLKQSYPFLINAITNNQINTLWGFGLSIIGGPLAMAIYNIGDQIYRAGGAITNIIAQATRIHFLGSSLKNIKFTLLFFVCLFLVISFSLIALSPFIITTFFSENFLPAISVLRIMIVSWGMHAVVKLLNYPILGETHGSDWVNRITYKILILHLITFFIWVHFFSSPLSLAIMFLLVIGCQLIIFLFYFYNKIKYKNNYSQ